MAANVLTNHNQNPYRIGKRTQHLVLFTAVDHKLSRLLGQSSIALRTMIVLASKLNAEGYACATLDELAKILGTRRSYVNKGVLELARWNLITKKKRSEYWIGPDVFRSAQIEV
ncbi:hypothetical protein [Spirosoma jeollabukense]